jgi:hypothetical protein
MELSVIQRFEPDVIMLFPEVEYPSSTTISRLVCKFARILMAHFNANDLSEQQISF